MAKTLGLIQVKGGVGRSTLATNIAGMIAETKTVALIDCDLPQATSASWYAIRKSIGKERALTIAMAKDQSELAKQWKHLSEQNDFVVIDAPPRIAEMTMATLILSDLSLIPIGPSLTDIWATSDLFSTIQLGKAQKPSVNAKIIWNKFRPTIKSAQLISQTTKEEFGLKALNSTLGYRVAYIDAYDEGLTVLEWRDKTARKEMRMLGEELERILNAKFLNQ
ncbi:MAG: AAA family ATPase [Nitrosospira sp.]